MNVRPNIGILNSLIRITLGLTILAWSTSKMVKRPWRESYLFMAMMGAMKVAEGIVRYCPVTALYEKGQDMMEQNEDDGEQDQWIPYNPS
ncbi:MAG TPA: DUF2892 domain-containing protein [Bacillus bacterium]|nr:DUF2892 domain-containing protein [Bacillus sp. (in: firmicutes)]